MSEPEEEAVLALCCEVLQRYLDGRREVFVELPLTAAKTAAEQEFLRQFNEFFQQFQEGMQFFEHMAEGLLAVTLPRHNCVFASSKQLHAALRHLVWQLRQLAQGDLSQEVYFMGEFTAVFNQLIEVLREKQQMEEKLRKSEEIYRAIVRVAPDGICIFDLEGKILDVSEQILQMFGFDTAQEVIGLNMYDYIAPEYRRKAMFLLSEMLAGRYTGVAEYKVRRRDGAEFWVESNAEVLRNKQGEVEALFTISRDISQKKQMEEQMNRYLHLLEVQAKTDRMTGVYNRSAGMEILQREITLVQISGQVMSVCFIDIDGLKYINDTFGHVAGDRIILAMVGCMKACIREQDAICRLGGDEFLLVLPACDEGEANLLLQCIERAVQQGNEQEEFPAPLSFSYGLQLINSNDAYSVDEIVRYADEMMYIQKRHKKIKK